MLEKAQDFLFGIGFCFFSIDGSIDFIYLSSNNYYSITKFNFGMIGLRGLLIVFCLVISNFVSAQFGKKKEYVQSSLVGVWNIQSAVIKGKQLGNIKFDDWEIEAIHFFKDSTVTIFGPKNENGGVIETSGVWSISDNGKVLLIKNRMASHTDEQILKDIEFPIKLTAKSLRISFPIDIKYPPGNGLKGGELSSKVWVYYIKM